MTVAHATPLKERVSVEDAQEELSKFFIIADIAEKAPEMFSKFIDAHWHALLAQPGDYDEFCNSSVGHDVGHVEDKGYGTPSWLGLYHERYGTLPSAWFASTEGIVDIEAYESYLDDRITATSFDCSPSTPDPDLIVAWDCTPTTNDPDFKPKAKPGVITSWDCTATTNDPDFARTQPTDPIPPASDEVTG